MPKISIDKADKDRAILTDTLPYETPIIFGNEGLYRFKKSIGDIAIQPTASDAQSIAWNLLFPKIKYSIPFSYQIRNNVNDRRTLSVIHPKSQIQTAEFYRKFDGQIIHQCSLSPCSLRYPASVSSHYFEPDLASVRSEFVNDSAEIVPEGFALQPRFGSTYFAYKRFNLLSRFLDSRPFLNLERKFHHLLILDIAKCFSSIYTHSIGWAVKSKEFSKTHKDTFSFESEFDRLMQGCNYNETNGIVIGPELSRVFAEIILQKVERNAIARLRESRKLRHEMHYAVRRYVDDYYIFSCDVETSDAVGEVLEEELENFKLFINKSKTTRMTVPFSTELTRARLEINKFLSFEFDKIIGDNSGEIFKFSYTRSKDWIVTIKGIVADRTANYVGISSLVLTRIRRFVSDLADRKAISKALDEQVLSSILRGCLDLAFFIYSMDARVRSTYLVAHSVVLVNRLAAQLDRDEKGLLRKTVFDGCMHALRDATPGESTFSLEQQNLLITLSEFGEEYLISPIMLGEIAGFSHDKGVFKPTIEHDYFQITSLLFYIRDFDQYGEIRQSVEKSILSKLASIKSISLSAERSMLLFDALSCPYISSATKSELSKTAVVAAGGSAKNLCGIFGEFRVYCARREWFVCWHSFINIQSLLNKKELKTPYE